MYITTAVELILFLVFVNSPMYFVHFFLNFDSDLYNLCFALVGTYLVYSCHLSGLLIWVGFQVF